MHLLACQSSELEKRVWQQCLWVADELIWSAIAEVQAQRNEIEVNVEQSKVLTLKPQLPQVGHDVGWVKWHQVPVKHRVTFPVETRANLRALMKHVKTWR